LTLLFNEFTLTNNAKNIIKKTKELIIPAVPNVEIKGSTGPSYSGPCKAYAHAPERAPTELAAVIPCDIYIIIYKKKIIIRLMKNNNNFLISIIFFLTTSTVISNGILMINEKDNLNFNNLSSNEQGFVVCLIYSEIYLILILIYNIIYYLYYCIFSCYSDGQLRFNYNCWTALFLLSGISIHIYLFYILVTHNIYINENVNTINIIFNVNFILIFFITCLFKFLKCKSNKIDNYENID
tara:strand:+ start:908 stop:1624 length:717 start_codon:yes stop_codon:yes gene_type:complete